MAMVLATSAGPEKINILNNVMVSARTIPSAWQLLDQNQCFPSETSVLWVTCGQRADDQHHGGSFRFTKRWVHQLLDQMIFLGI